MSSVEVTRAVYDAFNRGRVPAVLGAMDDNIKWEEPRMLPYGSHVGKEAVTEKVFGLVMQHLDGFSVRARRVGRRWRQSWSSVATGDAGYCHRQRAGHALHPRVALRRRKGRWVSYEL